MFTRRTSTNNSNAWFLCSSCLNKKGFSPSKRKMCNNVYCTHELQENLTNKNESKAEIWTSIKRNPNERVLPKLLQFVNDAKRCSCSKLHIYYYILTKHCTIFVEKDFPSTSLNRLQFQQKTIERRRQTLTLMHLIVQM